MEKRAACPDSEPLLQVMGRQIDGTIPRSIMDGTATGDWDPSKNTIGGADPGELVGNERYERWLEQFHVAQEMDKVCPEFPTALARKFERYREIPQAEVEQLLEDLLSAQVREPMAALMEHQLGRPLEPHDIYMEDMFDSRPPEEMNALVKSHYANHQAFEAGLPQLLRSLGFPDDDADFLGTNVRVEIARGSGHAMRPGMPEYTAWLRTSSLENELGWAGFDTAMHELGHNLEQVISTHFVPRPALQRRSQHGLHRGVRLPLPVTRPSGTWTGAGRRFTRSIPCRQHPVHAGLMPDRRPSPGRHTGVELAL